MDQAKKIVYFTVFMCFIFIGTFCLAQTPPASQTAGGVTKQEKVIEQEKALKERIIQQRPEATKVTAEDIVTPSKGPKVLVNRITVEGSTLLSEEEIHGVLSLFEGHELSLKEMQKVADLLTDEYRKKGYVTSRAYLPPQTIKDGVLLIRVIEGTLGKIDIKGNHHFKTSLLEKKIGIKPSGYFDYSALQRALVYINEHPDRVAKAILVPGKEPGTTDVVLEVEDRLPIHVGYEYDNWGSRYINRHRHSIVFEHNNLFGNDDKLYFKAQQSESERLDLQQARYVFPLKAGFEVGGYALFSKLKLGEEFVDLDSRGKAEIFGLFVNKAIIEQQNLDVRANVGFDYKSIANDLQGAQLSRDELRVFKTGLDIDVSDSLGRTIITSEADIGVPHLWGAMAAKDVVASRVGAGGKFSKGVFNVFRLQPMPLETSLLWKNTAQYTNNTLTASEQFQIGGPASVRGYPPAEYSGDKGYYTALELSIPPYPLSDSDKKVPFTNERIYDTFRFVVFWDWATTHLKNISAGEKEHRTLRGAGFGARLNLSEHLDCRVEVGYPLGGDTPSDGDHAHPWIEFTYMF